MGLLWIIITNSSLNHASKSVLSVQAHDNCVLLSKGRVVVFANILTHDANLLLMGHKFKHVQDLYCYRCRSSLLSISLVSHLENRFEVFSSVEVVCKRRLFPKQAFFPVFHLL